MTNPLSLFIRYNSHSGMDNEFKKLFNEQLFKTYLCDTQFHNNKQYFSIKYYQLSQGGR